MKARIKNFWNNEVTEYWLTYYVDKITDRCSICDDAGKLKIGERHHFCFCPNGQELRKATEEKGRRQ